MSATPISFRPAAHPPSAEDSVDIRLTGRSQALRLVFGLLPWLFAIAAAVLFLPSLQRLIDEQNSPAARELPGIALMSGFVTLILCVWFGVFITQLLARIVDKGLRGAGSTSRVHTAYTFGPTYMFVNVVLVLVMVTNLAFDLGGTPVAVKILSATALLAIYWLLAIFGGQGIAKSGSRLRGMLAWQIAGSIVIASVACFI
ncbi:hypothetical protein [Haematomicrobium sanguinis]|uniref:hypothetical protein n=1 Tax=Haematomicrobium sanguinis TaxID=479106 RepID=UPI00047A789B|nr:hypothetical protein [Haematomicrobium sanguinis]